MLLPLPDRRVAEFSEDGVKILDITKRNGYRAQITKSEGPLLATLVVEIKKDVFAVKTREEEKIIQIWNFETGERESTLVYADNRFCDENLSNF